MCGNDWKEVKLGDVCEMISRGMTPSYTDNKEVMVINQKCIRNNQVSFATARYTDPEKKKIADYKFLVDGDILVNSTGVGTLGRVAQIKRIKRKLTVDSHVTIVRTNDTVHSDYVGYNLILKQPNIEALATGSTGQTELSRKRLGEEIELQIPPLQEQKAIAATLSCLDDKIELNNRMNKKLEEMAQAIFKSWFVDFEPFQDGEFVDSELGKIPKGWNVDILESTAIIIMGQSPKGSSYNEEKNGEIFYQGRTDFGNRYPKRRLYTTEPKKMAKQKDILMSVRAPVGDINQAYENCCIGRGLCAIRSKNAYNSFLLRLMKSLQTRLKVYDNEGTVFGSINKTTLSNIKIIIPPKKVIEGFENMVEKIDTKYLFLSKQIELLIQLRNTLLPKLMAGEVRVPIPEVK